MHSALGVGARIQRLPAALLGVTTREAHSFQRCDANPRHAGREFIARCAGLSVHARPFGQNWLRLQAICSARARSYCRVPPFRSTNDARAQAADRRSGDATAGADRQGVRAARREPHRTAGAGASARCAGPGSLSNSEATRTGSASVVSRHELKVHNNGLARSQTRYDE